MGFYAPAQLVRNAREHGVPVGQDAKSLVLVGIVARSDLIKPSLVHFDDEEKRERMRGLPWQTQQP